MFVLGCQALLALSIFPAESHAPPNFSWVQFWRRLRRALSKNTYTNTTLDCYVLGCGAPPGIVPLPTAILQLCCITFWRLS